MDRETRESFTKLFDKVDDLGESVSGIHAKVGVMQTQIDTITARGCVKGNENYEDNKKEITEVKQRVSRIIGAMSIITVFFSGLLAKIGITIK